jgi:hypothetical protein
LDLIHIAQRQWLNPLRELVNPNDSQIAVQINADELSSAYHAIPEGDFHLVCVLNYVSIGNNVPSLVKEETRSLTLILKPK